MNNNTQLLKARSQGMTYAKGIKYQIDTLPPIPFKKITTKDLMKFLDSYESQSIAGQLIMETRSIPFTLQLNEPWYNPNNI